ncbi:MAG: Sfum_1244 family protein [Granulosicoccus sp.]
MASQDNELTRLCATVQANCAISDARFARNYSLCVYLLRMREYYRWQYNIPLGKHMPTDVVRDWVTAKEMHWDDIEEDDYQPLSFAGNRVDPFDSVAVNAALQGKGLIYSAGIGRMGQPHFVLAKHIATTHPDNHTICVETGIEKARDIITQPAMAIGNTVIIRHDCISRLLWQMIEEWQSNQTPGPVARVARHYNLVDNWQLDQAIHAATEDLCNVFRAHEFGEVEAGQLLGKPWQDMAVNMIGTRGELYVRAVRDLLADSLHTLPMILERDAGHYLDFWLAGIQGVRLQLLDKTPLDQMRMTDCSDTRLAQLALLQESASSHWQAVAGSMLEAYAIAGSRIDFETVTIAANG